MFLGSCRLSEIIIVAYVLGATIGPGGFSTIKLTTAHFVSITLGHMTHDFPCYSTPLKHQAASRISHKLACASITREHSAIV
jgi:hypothetical protein